MAAPLAHCLPRLAQPGAAQRQVAVAGHSTAEQPQRLQVSLPSCGTRPHSHQRVVCCSSSAGLPHGASPATPPEAAGEEAAPPPVSWWRRWQNKARSLKGRLKSYGLAGLVAYGICNTLYYTCAFVFIWCYIVEVPRGLGYAEASKRFVEVMGLTWAYSQVTKVGRAGAAVALAPFVDGCLLMIQCRLGLRNRQAAFYLVTSICCLVAAVVFGGVIAIWS